MNYEYKGEVKSLKKSSLTASKQHTFAYEYGARAVRLTVNAIGGRAVMRDEQITSSPQCKLIIQIIKSYILLLKKSNFNL